MAQNQALNSEADSEQMFRFDFRPGFEVLDAKCYSNQSNRTDIMKKYLVYMELPKIKIGDYRKSSCVSGNIIRFHFLLRIAKDEASTVLRLLPVKTYKAPVVNFAVIHRPFLEDDDAKGPIPKSPGLRSPLIRYAKDDDEEEDGTSASAPAAAAAAQGGGPAQVDDIAEDFRKPAQETEQPVLRPQPQPQPQQQPGDSVESSPNGAIGTASPQGGEPDENGEEERQFEVESPSRLPQEPTVSPALLDDTLTGQTGASAHRQKQRRPKKYFVYCEIPKVLIGDYRNSSVICSEIIHAHFLVKVAKDEENDQPRLQPIRRYHRPKVNFAVIHRSLLVDDEAIGPIPRSPHVKSPMIRRGAEADDDDDNDDVDKEGVGRKTGARGRSDGVLHATMGFCYGRLPRSKYELLTQWSLVPGASGEPLPELVLSKGEEA